jgi:2-polyprenyl-6-hydroxyphenyl methylase/3-demethylubiquinone-9 3-methyltransferase
LFPAAALDFAAQSWSATQAVSGLGLFLWPLRVIRCADLPRNTSPSRACVFMLSDNRAMTSTLNADPAELAKFSDLAHRWWDTESEFRPLHQINPLRLEWIDQLTALQGQTVLDVGCGGGILADAMARKGARVLGIDLSTKALKVAQLHALEAQTPGVQYREISAEALALEQPGSFDVVTCMEMLEHVPDPASVVQACATLVKPGGRVFFSTLNRSPKSFLFAILGAEYLLNLLPRGTHEYAKMIRPSELARYCRAAGLELQHTRGMEYNPLTRRYWLSADTSVNYLFATQKSMELS